MKEEQCHYIDSDLHDLMTQNPVKDDESNTLKLSKTNDINESIFQQNFRVLFSIINKNVSISFEIQIHQDVNLNLIDQVVARYSIV